MNGRWKDLAVLPIDAPREAKLLLQRPGEQYPTDWSPDGKYVVYTEFPPAGGSSVWMVPAGGGEPVALAQSGFIQGAGRVSPNGRWLAFDSDETGQPEVYLQPFPGPGRKMRVSSSGGRTPQWSRTGREIYYMKGDTLAVARLRPGPTLEVESRATLFPFRLQLTSPLATYDVMPDGRSFVVASDREAGDRLAVFSDIRLDSVGSARRSP